MYAKVDQDFDFVSTQAAHRLIVSHSHSCGPVPVPAGVIVRADCPLGMPAIMPGPTTGRCVMPKLLAKPRLAAFDIAPNPLLDPNERAASLDPVEFSGLSMSITLSPPALLLCLRCRFADIAIVRGRDAAPGPGVDLGGAAAIGTTPFPPTAAAAEPALPWKLVGLLPAVFAPEATPPLAGDSPAFTLAARLIAGGVEACAAVLADEEMLSVEFLRVLGPDELAEALTFAFFLADLVLVPPTGALLPEPRFRFLMTSVFKLRGLTTP